MKIIIGTIENSKPAEYTYDYVKDNPGVYELVENFSNRVVISTKLGVLVVEQPSGFTFIAGHSWQTPDIKYQYSNKTITFSN